MKRTKQLTLAAMFTSLCVLFSTISSYIPIGSGIFLILGSAMICGIVCECGTRYAFIGFAASALLILILSADKAVPALFAAFIGWYPIAKLYIDRIPIFKKRLVVQLLIGLVLCALYIPITHLLGIKADVLTAVIIVPGVVMYDMALSSMIIIYYDKIRKHIR